MIQFQLPRNSPINHNQIYPTFNAEQPKPVISHALCGFLNDIKHRIDKKEREWDNNKRYTNPYEYIHSLIPNKKKSVAITKPLSRSYFKMIELIIFYKLDFPVQSLHSFHLAEGPGGFIEALSHSRKNHQDKYIGMSILDDHQDHTIPAWKKSKQFLKENPNVYIEVGKDKTGDILKIENLDHCKQLYAGSMHIITGDGGFDFSTDFNNQENHISKLLFAQVVYALVMQKRGGHFVLKMFDCFMEHTIDILSILSSYYGKVYITKPQTSRYANSEKYLVCKDFLSSSIDSMYPCLRNAMNMMITNPQCVHRFLNNEPSLLFKTKIAEYNTIFGQQQITNIHYTLTLIYSKPNNEKLSTLVKTHVQKCISWCKKHNEAYNSVLCELSSKNNVFMSKQE